MRSIGSYAALGTTIELHASGRLGVALRDSCADLLATDADDPQHIIEVTRRSSARWTVRVDGVARARTVGTSTVVHEVLTALNELATASAIEQHTVLNAGALEINGVAVAVVGVGFARKSMIAAAVLQQQCGYLSDGVVAIDAVGSVKPFHRPLRFGRDQAAALGLPEQGGRFRVTRAYPLGKHAPLSFGAPLRLIVLVERTDSTSTTEHLHEPLALLRLANQTLSVAGYERVMFRRLDHLVRKVPVISVAANDREGALTTVRVAVADLLRPAAR